MHLEDILSSWSLPVQFARRWMQPARDAFAGDEPLELFVQLDPVGGLVSIELTDPGGAKLFATEAHLGEPAVRR